MYIYVCMCKCIYMYIHSPHLLGLVTGGKAVPDGSFSYNQALQFTCWQLLLMVLSFHWDGKYIDHETPCPCWKSMLNIANPWQHFLSESTHHLLIVFSAALQPATANQLKLKCKMKYCLLGLGVHTQKYFKFSFPWSIPFLKKKAICIKYTQKVSLNISSYSCDVFWFFCFFLFHFLKMLFATYWFYHLYKIWFATCNLKNHAIKEHLCNLQILRS